MESYHNCLCHQCCTSSSEGNKERDNLDTDNTTERDNTNSVINLDSDPPDTNSMVINSDTESYTIASEMASTYDEEFILQEIKEINKSQSILDYLFTSNQTPEVSFNHFYQLKFRHNFLWLHAYYFFLINKHLKIRI